MPNVQVYILDQLCDLKGDETIEVDYTSFDISKIGSRGSARSYESVLPPTNRNKQILENPEMVNNLSRVPYTRLPCLVLVDGVDVQIRFCEVQSAKIGAGYSIRYYGSNADLFATLNDIKLFDLDFSDWDHIWTMANVYASRLNTVGYIYAIIDYHSDSPNAYLDNQARNIRVDFMPPSFFVNTILAKIFETIGFELDNEAGDDTDKLLMPLTFSAVEPAPFISEKYEGVLAIYSQMEVPSVQNVFEFFAFDAVVGNTGNYYNFPYYVPNTNKRALRVEDSMYFKLSFSIDITILNPVNDVQIRIQTIYANGNVWANYDYPIPQNLSVGTHTFTFNYHPVTIQTIQKEIYITVQFTNASWLFGVTDSFFVESTSTITVSEVVYWGALLDYNQFLNVTAIMPDMTQTQFLKNYMLLFGLLPTVNEATKKTFLTKFSSIVANLANAYDWSSKLDYTEEAEVRYILNEYAQNNYFKWKKDGEELVPVDANGQIVINNKNLELEKTIVELDFAATNMVFRLNNLGTGNNIIPQIGIYKEGVLSNNKQPRFLQLSLKTTADIDAPLGLQYDDGSTSQGVGDHIPFAYFIDISQTWNLGFGNNILQNYYSQIAAILDRLKIVKVFVRLSAADISDLDFKRPVWIDKYESYFYISSIKGFSYTESRSTLVELVKLNVS